MKRRNVYTNLWIMMFLQFMQFAVWWVPLAAYLTNLNLGSMQKALILSSMAIGCIFSPIVGAIADRQIPGNKLLIWMNLLTALMLLIAGFQSDPNLLFGALMLAMLFYMPSWGLTSSIAMAHLPSEQFPRVRLAGSLGWVASGIFSLIAVRLFNIDFDGTRVPLFFGSGLALVAALSNILLPSTPPLAKNSKSSLIDSLGLKSLVLMKDRNFAVFVVISFFAFIPFALYWSYLSQFLQDIGYKYITVTMNFGQLAEILILFLVPLVLKRVGLRMVMNIGLFALFVRFLALYLGSSSGMDWLLFAAILVHGVIYGFFSVGGQIYIDKFAPDKLKSQAQGFIFLITFGLGILVGNFFSAKLISFYTIADQSGVSTVQWDKVWAFTGVVSFIILILFSILFKQTNENYSIK